MCAACSTGKRFFHSSVWNRWPWQIMNRILAVFTCKWLDFVESVIRRNSHLIADAVQFCTHRGFINQCVNFRYSLNNQDSYFNGPLLTDKCSCPLSHVTPVSAGHSLPSTRDLYAWPFTPNVNPDFHTWPFCLTSLLCLDAWPLPSTSTPHLHTSSPHLTFTPGLHTWPSPLLEDKSAFLFMCKIVYGCLPDTKFCVFKVLALCIACGIVSVSIRNSELFKIEQVYIF